MGEELGSNYGWYFSTDIKSERAEHDPKNRQGVAKQMPVLLPLTPDWGGVTGIVALGICHLFQARVLSRRAQALPGCMFTATIACPNLACI